MLIVANEELERDSQFRSCNPGERYFTERDGTIVAPHRSSARVYSRNEHDTLPP